MGYKVKVNGLKKARVGAEGKVELPAEEGHGPDK